MDLPVFISQWARQAQLYFQPCHDGPREGNSHSISSGKNTVFLGAQDSVVLTSSPSQLVPPS